MNHTNFHQVLLLLDNQPHRLIHELFTKEEFFITFLYHLHENFSLMNVSFGVLEPLLEFELDQEQQTAISIDQIEVGVISLLKNSFFDVFSLVYSSTTKKIQFSILEFDRFEELTIFDYHTLVTEVSSVLIGEKLFYKTFVQR